MDEKFIAMTLARRAIRDIPWSHITEECEDYGINWAANEAAFADDVREWLDAIARGI